VHKYCNTTYRSLATSSPMHYESHLIGFVASIFAKVKNLF